MPPPPASWQYIRIYSPGGTCFAACWLFKTSATSWPLTFWPWKWWRVTCDVGYLCANFSLPRPLCSRLRPDVHDRQTDVRQKHPLMSSPYGGRGIISTGFFLGHLSTEYCENQLSRFLRKLRNKKKTKWKHNLVDGSSNEVENTKRQAMLRRNSTHSRRTTGVACCSARWTAE